MSFQRVRPEELEAGEAASGALPIASAPAALAADDSGGVTRMLDDLLSALILPPEEEERRKGVHHLSGQIARVRLPTLCSLFEMENLSGVLVVRRDIEEVRIYVADGRFVDVEPVAAGETAPARLRSVLRWEEGAFEFNVLPVNRGDQIGMKMTALLIDMARESDEARQAKEGEE
jgi:hypothetical protein